MNTLTGPGETQRISLSIDIHYLRAQFLSKGDRVIHVICIDLSRTLIQLDSKSQTTTVIFAVVVIETSYRKIPVQYAKRMQGNRMYGGQASHLPLKINSAGVIPPIFASSILAFPATIAGFTTTPWVQAISDQLLPGRLLHSLLFVMLIFFFCFFYTAIQFNPVKIADEMKRHNGYIPGIRPGKKTAEYINAVLTRLTFGGAVYLSMICILPSILLFVFNVPFQFGGTALLIVVGVGLDLVNQINPSC